MSLEDDIREMRSLLAERRLPEVEDFEAGDRVCAAANASIVLQRRIDDLEDYLYGAAMQFRALSGKGL